MVLSNRPVPISNFGALVSRDEPKGEEVTYYIRVSDETQRWIIAKDGDRGFIVWFTVLNHDGSLTWEGLRFKTEAEARSEVEWDIAEMEVG